MLTTFQQYLQRRKMKRRILRAVESAYSEQFLGQDFDQVMETFVGKGPMVDVLYTYISIYIGTRLTEPLKDADVNRAVNALREAMQHIGTPKWDEIVDVYGDLAKMCWMLKTLAIMKGKVALKNNEYSYEAVIYSIQHTWKGPVPESLRDKWRKKSKEMSALEVDMEEQELKALRAASPELYKEAIIKAELDKLTNEGDEILYKQNEVDCEAAISELERKLEYSLRGKEVSESDNYQTIMLEFNDMVTDTPPLIGDCNTLPRPKDEIQYAISWLLVHYRTIQSASKDPEMREKWEDMISTFSYLATHLARDWQEIAPEDREAVARLGEGDSFPEWAFYLRDKYIDDDKASEYAAKIAVQVMVDKVAQEKRGANGGK